MKETEILKQIWDNKATKNHKHFVQHMPSTKIDDHLKRFNNYVLKFINTDDINWSLDWGCGGGLFSKELAKFSNVTLLDISQESLEQATNYIGNTNSEIKQVLIDDITKLNLADLPKIDLIVCYSVIQHFPSYKYYTQVTNCWKKLQPKYIAFQTKLSPKIEQSKNYTHARNYLNGLLMDKASTLSPLEGYEPIHWTQSIAPASGQPIAFTVLKRT